MDTTHVTSLHSDCSRAKRPIENLQVVFHLQQQLRPSLHTSYVTNDTKAKNMHVSVPINDTYWLGYTRTNDIWNNTVVQKSGSQTSSTTVERSISYRGGEITRKDNELLRFL